MRRRTIIIYSLIFIAFTLPLCFSFYSLLGMRRNARLIVAVKKSDLRQAEALLNAGANPNARDYDLQLETPGQNQPGYYALSQNGISAWSGARRSTVLECAVGGEHENTELVLLLIQHGAQVNFADESGMTPLSIAAWYDHKSLGKMLIEKGADVNAVDKNGVTPVMVASANGSLASLKLLIEARADISAKDNLGQTALDKAEAAGKTQAVQYIKSILQQNPVKKP